MSAAARLGVALSDGALPLPGDGDVLVLRGRTGEIGEALPRDRLVVEQPFRPDFDALAATGIRVVQRAADPAAMVLVLASRARVRSLGDVARGLELLVPGAVLALDGARTDGIDALARKIAAVLPLAGQVTKAHGRLVWLHRPVVLPPAVSDWAAAALPRRNDAGFETAPGMFSPAGIDPGSRRLAAHLAGALRGRVADLGAGWGWLAAEALARCPEIAAIDLFEADAEALDAARRNITDPRAAFHWADVGTLSGDGTRFDAAISNPPFHQGRAAEPALGAAFIAAAARILKPKGTFLLVANRQLPYEAPLAAAFGRVTTLDQDRHFKVLSASRPIASGVTPAAAARPRAGRHR
jgi:16S rRNA (guanine1207-N2)-methyltransferase